MKHKAALGSRNPLPIIINVDKTQLNSIQSWVGLIFLRNFIPQPHQNRNRSSLFLSYYTTKLDRIQYVTLFQYPVCNLISTQLEDDTLPPSPQKQTNIFLFYQSQQNFGSELVLHHKKFGQQFFWVKKNLGRNFFRSKKNLS